MDKIKDVVNAVIGNLAEHNPQLQSKSERIWENLLSEQERKHTKLIGIKEQTLFVNVDSPAWFYQMRIQQSKILMRLKDELADIKYIRFKIGKIK